MHCREHISLCEKSKALYSLTETWTKFQFTWIKEVAARSSDRRNCKSAESAELTAEVDASCRGADKLRIGGTE